MLRKPTIWYRATVTAVPSIIVPAEAGVPEDLVRCVTLCIREDPPVQIGIDVDPKAIAARDGYLPEPPVNKTLTIRLLATQFITARAEDRVHELSVIVEYHKNG